MKISYNWLKEYVSHDLSPEALSDALTMLGLETEGLPQRMGGPEGGLEGVVVGEIIQCEKHPNADRLSLCKVDVGQGDPLQIVCGAPNVAAGQKVPVAMIGTKLYPVEGEPFKIKKGKIRGELSQGMICAEDELGLGSSHEGIMVLTADINPGTAFAAVAPVEQDWMIEIDLTPNRIDAASHYGVARDLAAYLGKQAHLPQKTLDKQSLRTPHPISVRIEDVDKCRRYTSLYIAGVKVIESPDWLRQRLQTIGLRPRNNVVDALNYVLHELGHPLHAFDADLLDGGEIVVRTLQEDQKYQTLDGETRHLKAGQDLMICDARQPRCIAGTMGGQDGSVTERTQNILLESAWFDPGTVRRTAKRLGINSDSSYRFERGADPLMTETALLRAAALVIELAGGKPSQVSDIVVGSFEPHQVKLSVNHVCKLIGKDISQEEIGDILGRLDIRVEALDADRLHLHIPPYRVDVQRPQDVIEEILRIHGYDEVAPSPHVSVSLGQEQIFNREALFQRYCDYLSANGYYEIINNSMYALELAGENTVRLANPLSEDLGAMRSSLLPGFLQTIQYNQNRQEEDLALYEGGRTYLRQGEAYQEKQLLCLALTGRLHPMHWQGAGRQASLFSLTKEAERLQHWFGVQGQLRAGKHPELAYALELCYDGRVLLQYGKVATRWTQAYEIRNEVFFMEIDWEALADASFAAHQCFRAMSPFPAIRRDLSLLLDQSVSFEQVRQLSLAANPKLIRSVDLHDIYTGKGVPENKKSYLISLLFRDDRKTLQDKAVEKIMQRVLHLLEKGLGAELRR